MRRKIIVCAVAVLVAAGFGAYTLNERRHVALLASGQWWCKGDNCELEGCAGCRTQERAACVSLHDVLKDRDFDLCSATMSGCEATRRALRDDVDVSGVGGCRVVSATTESREYYNALIVIAWILIGAAALVLLIARPWKRQHQASPEATP